MIQIQNRDDEIRRLRADVAARESEVESFARALADARSTERFVSFLFYFNHFLPFLT
jgi:hypothetical protein